jgi:hypothetical protein
VEVTLRRGLVEDEDEEEIKGVESEDREERG